MQNCFEEGHSMLVGQSNAPEVKITIFQLTLQFLTLGLVFLHQSSTTLVSCDEMFHAGWIAK